MVWKPPRNFVVELDRGMPMPSVLEFKVNCIFPVSSVLDMKLKYRVVCEFGQKVISAVKLVG